MPPPASESKPIPQPKDRLSASAPSPEDQERLQRRLDALLEDQKAIKKAAENSVAALKEPSPAERQEQPQEEPAAPPQKDDSVDNIARVPDENLPSHRERQRWNLSRRFSEAMDELLPKLAVVTQKVNTYTGTDYSGVEALRREIKEQEKLVQARRLAIDSARQVLDTALAHQASSQKEVVALLERKHSWSNGDLERYMALIRSEHINDQAVREAKEAVADAENALEDARAQLEKRERAQYHEEQIWSDTIRRNSTWVTFGLMGVNIFLLLLSLAILEPWRRRRMVREIKNTLEAQQRTVMEASAAPTLLSTGASPSAREDLAAIEEEIDRAMEYVPALAEPEATTPAMAATVAEESPAARTDISTPEVVPIGMPQHPIDASLAPAVPKATPLAAEINITPQESNTPVEEVPSLPTTSPKSETWQQKASAMAHDIVSERVISMRRIDYTAAVLRSAAAGALITAAIIAMMRPN
ncbi:hypothetical protein BDW02DRAFT_489992 [Decorospora gaudefroyi]|uniref:Sensitive to high expression protein 9, mitochondrial n=1 Tax=Decorospora gaudefroyi TaxID=184978 RepID=A0A6A5KT70_9PLEO|nr:hypothetical protein BDW02DRAFT_489992 [Decorospora gaudefroyi]